MGLQKNISRKRTRDEFYGEKPSRSKNKRRFRNTEAQSNRRRDKFDNYDNWF
jgi:hypothetical protein